MNSRTKGIAASTVGYLCLGIGAWMVAMSGAGWYSPQFGVAILLPLSVVLLAIGILALTADRGLDAVAFFGGAVLFGFGATYVVSIGAERVTMSLSYMGWFAATLAVYFLCLSAGSLRSGGPRAAFFAGTWISLGCLAIAGWSATQGWEIAAGYLGLITSLLAFATAGSEVVSFGKMENPNLPNFEMPRTTARPMAAD